MLEHIDTIKLANTILQEAKRRKIPVNSMKLQRLLYLTFAIYYQKTGNLLFSEPWTAWAYGPVCQSVYWKFSSFHAKPIKTYGKDAAGEAHGVNLAYYPNLRRVLTDVYELYLDADAKYLCELTRQKGGAWWEAYQNDRETLLEADILTDPCGQIGD